MIMENGFSSPRAGAFPVGLRVLVVDDDPTWLKILEKMLKKCSYEVTTCCLARDALNLLRERKDGFDIVISDVNMPDMDGFKLLEHVGLEMDLPVIMMSVDGETSRVMKGVQHGACDYLLKPIRMKELKNIWQHVLRKRIHEVRDADFIEGVEGIQMTRTGSDLSDEAYFLFGDDMTSPKKRKDTEFMYDDKEPSDVSSSKKARVVWSIDLHQEFVKAVDQIGYDKVGPKKILDLMNVPWLTRENVASHLQKYRLYLSRLQKDSDHNHPSGGVAKLSDMSPSDSIGSFGTQNHINILHKDTTNGRFEYSSNSQLVQNMVRRSVDPDRTASTQIYGAEPRRALGIDVPDPRKPRSASVECRVAFPLPKLEANCAAQYPWRDIPSSQPKQENKPSFVDGNLSQFPMDGQWQHLTADSVQPTLSAGCTIGSSGECRPNASPVNSVWSSDNRRPLETTTSVPDRQSIVTVPNHQAIVSVPHHQDIISVPNHQAIVSVPDHHQEIVSVPSLLDQLGMKNQGFDWDCIPEYGSVQKHVNLGVQAFTNLDESLPFCFVKGDCLSTNLAAQNLQFPEMSCHSGLISEGPMHLFDGFDNEGLYDPAECSLFDPGLFIV